MSDRMLVFDRALVRRRRQRFARNFAASGFLVEEVVDRLLDRLGDIRREFRRVLVLGAPLGLVETALAGRLGTECLVAVDAAGAMLAGSGLRVVADAEALPFGAGQLRPRAEPDDPALGQRPAWHAGPAARLPRAGRPPDGGDAGRRDADRAAPMPDPGRARMRGRRSARACRPSPMCATPAPCCSGRASPCRWSTSTGSPSVTPSRCACCAISAGWARPTRCCSAARGRCAVMTLARACQLYGELFADAEGRVPATFDILFMAGWKPHPSQQQPARRRLRADQARRCVAHSGRRAGLRRRRLQRRADRWRRLGARRAARQASRAQASAAPGARTQFRTHLQMDHARRAPRPDRRRGTGRAGSRRGRSASTARRLPADQRRLAHEALRGRHRPARSAWRPRAGRRARAPGRRAGTAARPRRSRQAGPAGKGPRGPSTGRDGQHAWTWHSGLEPRAGRGEGVAQLPPGSIIEIEPQIRPPRSISISP